MRSDVCWWIMIINHPQGEKGRVSTRPQPSGRMQRNRMSANRTPINGTPEHGARARDNVLPPTGRHNQNEWLIHWLTPGTKQGWLQNTWNECILKRIWQLERRASWIHRGFDLTVLGCWKRPKSDGRTSPRERKPKNDEHAHLRRTGTSTQCRWSVLPCWRKLRSVQKSLYDEKLTSTWPHEAHLEVATHLTTRMTNFCLFYEDHHTDRSQSSKQAYIMGWMYRTDTSWSV